MKYLFVLVVVLLGLGRFNSHRLGAGILYDYKHHNNFELNKLLMMVNTKCPDITRLYELSERSVNNWPLTVIEISSNPGQHELCK